MLLCINHKADDINAATQLACSINFEAEMTGRRWDAGGGDDSLNCNGLIVVF